MTTPPLRILLTCRELVLRAGSQLYTRDVAETLRRLGHSPVVFSPRLGPVAEELRARGVAVIDRLDRLGEPPSVIHGQHHAEAMEAMLRFPRVPALFVCHGWLPFQEAPPLFPSLLRYVAVDGLRRDRLVLEHGIAASAVTVIPNFVDLERFRPRGPLPARPRRALLLSNQAAPYTFVPEVERAAAAAGLELTVAGLASGNPVARPEELLPGFDLVFARGRTALEAMAVGAAVILCDVEGGGPLVTAEGFAALREVNFGLAALRPPVEAERLLAEIRRYDPCDAERVSERVRAEAGRQQAVARLVELYRELVAAAPALAGAEHERACLEAAARYVRFLGAHADAAESRLAAGATALAQAEGRVEHEAALRAAAETRATAAEGRLAEATAVLETLEGSPFSRLRGRLLNLRPLVSAYRSFKAWREG